MKVMMMIGFLYDGDGDLIMMVIGSLYDGGGDMVMMVGSLALACWRLRDY